MLDEGNYQKAKAFLIPLAQSVNEEAADVLHLGMTVDSWVVELHGTLRTGLGKRIDNEIDSIQDSIFKEGRVRVWRNGKTDVFLPAPDDDVVFVFSYILQHFFKGGIGLRQICDWCRLLWTYRDTIDKGLLEGRLKRMGLMSEWKTFAALAVEWLGMPVEALPLYSSERKWSRKARKVMAIVLETGNFGHNRDMSYYEKYPYLVFKAISWWNYTCDSLRHMMIFPKDAARVWLLRLKASAKAVAKGK